MTHAGRSAEMNPGRQISLISMIIFSNLPDVDYLFGTIKGNPNLYHHLWTHSIVFGIFVGFMYWFFKKSASYWAGLIVSCLMFSHILLDYFTLDTNPPFGIQLFWPISKTYFISPVSIFRDVSKASANKLFIQSLFCWHNLKTVLVELVLLGPIGLAFWIFQKMKSRKTPGDGSPMIRSIE
jgi:membrane-bound metal-dependent hydrolase YbcI (DUF457 family)